MNRGTIAKLVLVRPGVVARPQRHIFQRCPVMNHVNPPRVDTPLRQQRGEIGRDYHDCVAQAGRLLVKAEEILTNDLPETRHLSSQQSICGQAVNVLNPRDKSRAVVRTPAGQPHLRNRRRIGRDNNVRLKLFALSDQLGAY